MITKLDDEVDNVAKSDPTPCIRVVAPEGVAALAATPFLIVSRGAFHSG